VKFFFLLDFLFAKHSGKNDSGNQAEAENDAERFVGMTVDQFIRGFRARHGFSFYAGSTGFQQRFTVANDVLNVIEKFLERSAVAIAGFVSHDKKFASSVMD
jgi:hypothetical protein